MWLYGRTFHYPLIKKLAASSRRGEEEAVNEVPIHVCVADLMFSFANNSCEKPSLKSEEYIIKSKSSLLWGDTTASHYMFL